MKSIKILGALALSLCLANCGETEESTQPHGWSLAIRRFMVELLKLNKELLNWPRPHRSPVYPFFLGI